MGKNTNENLLNAFLKNMKKHKGNRKAQFIIIVVFCFIAIGTYVFGTDFVPNMSSQKSGQSVSGNLEISYLDVGQGDSAYIRVNDFDILIDAGPRSDSDKLMKQLENKQVIITGTEKSIVPPEMSPKLFRVEKGIVKEV